MKFIETLKEKKDYELNCSNSFWRYLFSVYLEKIAKIKEKERMYDEAENFIFEINLVDKKDVKLKIVISHKFLTS